MDYKKLNDYELIYQVKENDTVAYNLLITKYSNLVDMLSKKYLKANQNIGIEYDDLYQEGMMGIFQAIKNYNQNDTLFYTFASLCAKREMERLIKGFRRNKQMVLNDSISFNESINDSGNVLEDLLASDFILEDQYISYCGYKDLLDLKYEFSQIDSYVYELKINNFSIKEIAILLELTYKNVDYRLHKIRKKILQLINI